jgi:hypothetical protein
MRALLVQEFHDIAPPVDYSLIPTWAIFAASVIALSLIGWIVWLVMRARSRRPLHVPTARDRALELLRHAETDVDYLTPYEFSIRISDILRQYVTEEYQLPLTRQTSVEFLNSLTQSSSFSQDDKALLDDFLSRCDLIKFARYEATREDSRTLLEEATRFVRGGALEPA